METLKDLIKSVKENAAIRVSNPLTGAFLLSWCVVNYRIWLVFLGSGTYEEKIKYIDRQLYQDYAQIIGNAFAFPALFALFWVFIFPFISIRVERFHRTHNIKHQAMRLTLEGITPLTQANAELLRERTKAAEIEVENQRLAHATQLEELHSDVRRLKSERAEAVQDLVKANQYIKEFVGYRQYLSPPLQGIIDNQVEAEVTSRVIVTILNSPISDYLDLIKASGRPDPKHAQDHLDFLDQCGLISPNNSEASRYIVNAEGIDFLAHIFRKYPRINLKKGPTVNKPKLRPDNTN